MNTTCIPKFALGRLLATPAALSAVSSSEIQVALNRHLNGDWGDLDRDDWQANEDSLTHGSRLLSAYHTADQTKFWIITEADRSVTTILLPQDY